MTPQEIQQLSASQRVIVAEQLSSVQLQQLTGSQLAAFGITKPGSQATRTQQGQQQQFTNTTNLNTNTTSSTAAEAVVSQTANSRLEGQRNQTQAGQDVADMVDMRSFKRDAKAAEDDVLTTFIAEAIEAQLGKRSIQSLIENRKMKYKRATLQGRRAKFLDEC